MNTEVGSNFSVLPGGCHGIILTFIAFLNTTVSGDDVREAQTIAVLNHIDIIWDQSVESHTHTE